MKEPTKMDLKKILKTEKILPTDTEEKKTIVFPDEENV